MPGQLFQFGEQKVRPDVYIKWHNAGGVRVVTGSNGIAAAVVKSNWGPLGEVIKLERPVEIRARLGGGRGPDVLQEVFTGGASMVLAVRAGTGGTPASVELKDSGSTPENVVRLVTKYPTSRSLSVTVRDTLEDPDLRELLVFEGMLLLERILFEKGANEPDRLTAAVNARSQFLVAAKLSDGSGSLSPVSDESLSDGTDPTVTGADYAESFEALAGEGYRTLVVDTEDVAVHASLQSFVNRMLSEGGGRLIGVVGGPTSVPFAERKAHAQSYNDFAIVYVGNGFETAIGPVEGARAAARVAGMIASSPYNASLTHAVITGSIGIVGNLTPAQYKEAVLSGMLTFSLNPQGVAHIDYGINTKVLLAEDEDEGWKKIRRTLTRYELIDRTVFTLYPYLGKWNNNENGRAFVITIVNGIIDTMIREGGLESGELILDPDTPPQGDSAWFKFVNLSDLDSIEKMYLDFGFQF